MAKQMLKVNCLVQVTTSNPQDFAEWLEYHIALGFDLVYIFDTGVRGWLEALADKYRDHVVMVPRDDWRKKHTIVETYTRRRRAPEWAVCLSDNEFIWLAPQLKCNIKAFFNRLQPDTGAVTAFTKYLSSEKPMKYRVGTQIDCFTHARQGNNPPNPNTPNTGVTFFHIVNPEAMPLKTNIIPNSNFWIDSTGARLTADIVSRVTSAPNFDPANYPLRCYKYALRSGSEMDFKPGTKPTGYVVSDPTMQRARELLLRIPVNLETETLFAKTEPPVADENPVVESAELSTEQTAELELPINAAKIDTMILRGNYFEDIVEYLNRNELKFDPAALERVFNREREEIIKSYPAYCTMQEMLDKGESDDAVMNVLHVTKTTYAIMRKCLMVLDIRSEGEPETSAETPTDIQVTPAAEQPIDGLVSDFEKSNAENELTPEQKAENEAKFAEESEKHQKKLEERRKKYAEKKTAKKSKPSKGKTEQPVPASAEKHEDTAAEVSSTTPEVVTADAAPADPPAEMPAIDSLLDDVDLTSLTEK